MPTRLQRHRARLLRRNDDGLSVMEMVVAIGVTMVVLISAGAAFVKMGEAQRSAEAADRGTQMIQDKLETIRTLPYNLVGCYTNDPPVDGVSACPLNVPPTNPTSPVNSSNGERVVNLGLIRPTVDMSGMAPTGVEENVIGDPASGNRFTVTTVVTWADLTNPRRTAAVIPPAGAPAPGSYPAKRVTVTASWILGKTTRSVTRQRLRSPTSTEVVPPSVGLDDESRCPLVQPFCSISITDGQVLDSALVLTKPVEFVVQMASPTMSPTSITVGSVSVTSIVTNGGYTHTHTVLAGSTSSVVRPGPRRVTITVTMSGRHWTATKDVSWRFPISADYQLSGLGGFAVNGTAGSAWTSGSEPKMTTPFFCVDTSGRLLRYTSVIFDEMNVDDMDGTIKPNLDVTRYGASGGKLTAVLSQHPSTVGAGGNGYVPTKSITPGSSNKITWSYIFATGTVFADTPVSVTVSGVRPGDGASASATLVMPVSEKTSEASCGSAP